MDRAAAKELLHIEGWLDRSAQIVERGKDAYLADRGVEIATGRGEYGAGKLVASESQRA